MATYVKPTGTHPASRPTGPAHIRRAALTLWLPTLLLFAGTFTLYAATATRANTFDAVSYANQIGHLYPRTGDPRWLFHPHHLLFNALGYALWRLAQVFGYRGGTLPVLQALNAALGAAGVSAFYLILRRLLQRSRWLPLLLSAGLAFSFGYWICATDGRVNMPSLLLLLCAFGVLCRAMQTPRVGLAAAVGALAGGALLLHESAGLFAVVGLAGVLLAEDDPLLTREAMRVRRRGMTLAYLATWGLTAGLPYFIVGVFVLHLRSPAAFHRWTSEYAELGWWWDFHVWRNLRLDLYAFRHAAFVEPPGKQGTFHLSRHVPVELGRLYWATLLGWLGASYAFLAALPLLWRSHNRRTMIVCVLWIAVYAAFFTVWSPGYFVFWVPVLIPTGVMLALALAHYRAGRGGLLANWLLGAWIALFAALNLQAGVLPHLAPNADPFRRIAADVRAHTAPGDIVLVAGAGDGGPCEVALPYFADREVVSLHGLLTKAHDDKGAAFQSAQARLDAALAGGHAVYALDEVVPGHDRRTLLALSTRHGVTALDLKALLHPYIRTFAWQSPRGQVWRLSRSVPGPWNAPAPTAYPGGIR